MPATPVEASPLPTTSTSTTHHHQDPALTQPPLMDASASSSSLPVTTDNNNVTLGASTTTTTTTTTTTDTTSSSTNMVIVGILVGLIAILTIILVILLVRPVMEYIKARLPENKRRKELRYRTVEGWVISKRIRPHDEVCAHALEHFAKTSAKNHSETTGDNTATTTTSSSSSCTLKPCTSYDTAETVVVVDQSMELEWKECPICMEEFKADEIVSWSPDDQTSCLHFFHHECIKEWLLRSPHCPYCRGTIIPVDDCRPNKVDKLTLLEMSKRRARKAATTYCCVEHGLVHLTHKPITNGTTPENSNPYGHNATTKTAKSRWKTRRDKIMWEAVLAPRVTPIELVAKRGGRNESGSSSSSTSLGECGDNDNDSELSSVIFAARGGGRPPLAAPSPLWLQPEHVVPPNVLLAELDTTTGAAVLQADQGDIEAPPVSGDLVRIVPSCCSEEQASSTTTTSRSRTVGTAADAV